MNEITIDATIGNVETVMEFINSELDKVNCSQKVQLQINIAVDELFSNIVNYAYGKTIGKATIGFEYDKDVPAVILHFIDNGIKYNPLEKEDPDITKGINERPEGGLGIFMVKKSMDGMEYEYKDGKNILKIKKNI